MDRKAIIFGATGQDGYYLTDLLLREKIEVVGIARTGAKVKGDVSNYNFVESQIKSHRPDYVFHLAANSTTKHDALFENHLTISTGTLNVLENVYKHSRGTKVFISGSGLQFVNTGSPISEKDPFEARDAYSISRIESVYAARYFRSLGLQVYIGYFFHHDSPFRSERHLNMRIAMAAKRIKEGSKELIEIGNIKVIKEFNYAGDLMKAVWLIMNQAKFFETVIGSGKGYAIEEWIAMCFDKVGLNWNTYVRTNDVYVPEFSSLISNPATLFSTGWRPEVSIDELVSKMVDI